MIKWIPEKVVGWPWCVHKWKTEEERNLLDGDHCNELIGKIVYLRCDKCGEWKRQRLAP